VTFSCSDHPLDKLTVVLIAYWSKRLH